MLKKTELMNNLSRTFHKTGFQLKKHSPEILVISGVVGVVVSTVMACKATTKLDQILEEGKERAEKIEKYAAEVIDSEVKEETEDTEETTEVAEYTEKDRVKDLRIVKVQTAFKVAKLYAPAVGVGLLSITAILSGHNITRKRNVALAAAYTAIDNSFKDYRKRVIERFGEELDKELRFGIKAKEVEETTTDEDGNETTTKKIVHVIDDPNVYSEYARIYDDGCLGWTKDPESNLVFLKQQQNFANDTLKAKGHLFLNEVYDAIGIPRSKAGQVVGWVYDEKNPVGDNFVDFGIFDIYNKKACDFVNGYERNIVLDFNVDGNIWDLM